MNSISLRQGLLTLFLAVPAAAMPAVHVVQPAGGTTLHGGSTAVVEWSGAVERSHDIEEWEAFLSVDGGRYYSVRITPHLDVSIRAFRWTVPNVSSSDARILLRFGNERDEHAIEVPISLKIEAGPASDVQIENNGAIGESARPGDPPVTQWAAGNRSGTDVNVVTASQTAFAATAKSTSASDDKVLISSAERAIEWLRSESLIAVAPSQQKQSIAFARDILLRSRRLNI